MVLGPGIDQGMLSSLVTKHLGSLGKASAQNASSTKYFGGQVRRELLKGHYPINVDQEGGWFIAERLSADTVHVT